jgi:hypothetical protein
MHKKSWIRAANKTSRSRGAIGKNALVPRLTQQIAHRDNSILDFGAGKEAIHTRWMRKVGFHRTCAYDFGQNTTPYHDELALNYQYDITMISNVLNIQQNESMLNLTVAEIARATKPGGLVIANYPRPRHLRTTFADVLKKFEEKGFLLQVIDSKNCIFIGKKK